MREARLEGRPTNLVPGEKKGLHQLGQGLLIGSLFVEGLTPPANQIIFHKEALRLGGRSMTGKGARTEEARESTEVMFF